MRYVVDPSLLGLIVYAKSGDEVTVLCPFHDDHAPSASFNVRTGLFYCFVCRVGLNLRQFKSRLGIASDADITIPESRLRITTQSDIDWRRIYEMGIRAWPDAYLQSRGVTECQVDEFGIRHCEEAILFPLRDHTGTLVGVQFRYYNRPKINKYLTCGTKVPIWPMEKYPPEKGVICVCEGIFGALNVRRAGYNGFATLSASIKKQNTPIFSGLGNRTIVMFDDDLSGHNGMLLVSRISGAKMAWPGGEFDEMTAEEIRVAVDGSISYYQVLKKFKEAELC